MEEKEPEKTNIVKQDYQRLIDNCHVKRVALDEYFSSAQNKKKRFILSAGILSILSAVSMTAVAAKIFDLVLLEFLGVILAASGGFAALFASTIYGEIEISNIISGSAKFQSLRERAILISSSYYLPWQDPADSYSELVKEYLLLSEIYDKYIPKIAPEEIRSIDYTPLYRRHPFAIFSGSSGVGKTTFSHYLNTQADKSFQIEDNENDASQDR